MDIPGIKHDGGPVDTTKKKKHREQLIVVGTLVLVILTFMMVARKGSDAPAGEPTTGAGDPTADGVGGVAGGGGGGDMYAWLPAAMSGLPGQVAALVQGGQNQIIRNQRASRRRERRILGREGTILKREKRITKKENRILTNQRRMEREILAMRHPRRPAAPITVHRRTAPTRHRATHHTTLPSQRL